MSCTRIYMVSGGDHDCLQVLKTKWVGVTPRDSTYISFVLLSHTKYINGLGVGISTVYKFSNRRVWGWPRGNPTIFHLICFVVQYKNIYGLGVGISTVYKFSNRKGWGWPRGTPTIFHLIWFVARYKNIYGLGVGIITVYKFSNRMGWVGWPYGPNL